MKGKPHKVEDNQRKALAALKRDMQEEHMTKEEEHTRLPVVQWACELGELVRVLLMMPYPLSTNNQSSIANLVRHYFKQLTK